MERRKFKSDISNSYVQVLMDRRRRKFGRPKHDTIIVNNRDKSKGSEIEQVFAVPATMMPKRKLRQDCQERREYDKPEHWLKPIKEVKPPREESLRAEKDNITKMACRRQSCSYSARNLVSATERPKHPKTRDGYIGPIRKASMPIE